MRGRMLAEIRGRICDSCCNENVTLKRNYAIKKLFCDYSMFVTLCEMKVHFPLISANGFHADAAVGLRCRQSFKF